MSWVIAVKDRRLGAFPLPPATSPKGPESPSMPSNQWIRLTPWARLSVKTFTSWSACLSCVNCFSTVVPHSVKGRDEAGCLR